MEKFTLVPRNLIKNKGSCIQLIKILFFFLTLFPAAHFNSLFGQCPANLSVSPSCVICQGSHAIITASATAGSSFHWYKDGISLDSTRNQLVVTTSGNYYVRTSPCGLNSNTKTITVNPVPSANFTYTPTGIPCASTPIIFNGPADAQTYLWNFGDSLSGASNTNTTQNPGHIFEAYGNGTQNFSVTLTTTNQYGCSSTSTQIITVTQKPDVTLTDPVDFPSFTLCSFESDTFALTVHYSPAFITSNNQYSIAWGDGTSDWISPTFPVAGVLHAYFSTGSFNLVFTVTGSNGCQNSKNYIIFNGSNPSLTVGSPGSTTSCVPATFIFPIGGWQGNTPSTSYSFNFGDQSPVITMYAPLPPSISHTYTTSSCSQPNPTYTYIISAVASNPCGSTPLTIGGVQVSERPFSYFTTTDSVFCVNDNVHFTNMCTPGCFIVGNNTNNSTNFTWNFGDGTTQTFTNIAPGNIMSQASANHTYGSPGIYIVSLKATNFGSGGCGDSTYTKEICVSAQPNSSFTLNQMNGCKPLTITATNTSTTTDLCHDRVYTWSVIYSGSVCDPITGHWNFTGGTNLHSANPTITFLDPGVYTITLAVHNHCQAAYSSEMIFVETIPSITLPSMLPAICDSGTISPTASFGNCYGNITAYNWTFPGGIPATSNQQIPGTISYNNAGTYTITASAINECGLTSKNTTLSVKQLPVTTAIPSSQTICNGTQTQAVSFSSSLPGTTYSWMANNPGGVGGIIPSGISNPIPVMVLTNPTFNPQIVTYTITPISNGCQGPGIIETITVNPSPNVSNTALNQSVCSGQTTTDVVLTSNVAGTTFSWTATATAGVSGFSTIGNSTIPPQTLTTSLLVNGFVTYTIIPSANGCDGVPVNYIITVRPVPQITNAPLSKSICSGSNTNIILTSNIIGSTFSWTASCTAGTITGFSASGIGNINDILINTGNTPGTVTYIIVPIRNGCPGIPTNFDVFVQPISNVVANPPTQSICSGSQNVAILLTSNVPGTSFLWSATSTPSIGISGFTVSGSGSTIPPEVISNFLVIQGIVTYTITPSINGCPGIIDTAVININPSPMVTNSPMNQTICSGSSTTPLTLTSNVSTTTFTWTASATPGITGFQASGTNDIPAQILLNNTYSLGSVTYHITPSSNLGMSCPGSLADYTINVNPVPDIIATPASQTICSGSQTAIMLSSDVSGTTFNWTASLLSGSVVGQSNGSGMNINQILVNTGIIDGIVRYTINTDASGCPGIGTIVDITIHPSTLVITTPLTSQAICSGDPTNIALSSNVTGAVFSWTASLTSGNVTGFSDGSGSLIGQTLINTGIMPGIVTYTIHANANGCMGPDKMFQVTVNAIPVLTTIPATGQSICSQSSTNIILNSTIPGTTYAWTGSLTTGTVTGFTSGSTNPIAQFLTNTGSTAGIVTYAITLVHSGCYGSIVYFPVTVNPLPIVNAGPDLTIPCGTADTLFGSGNGGNGNLLYNWVPAGLIASGSNTATAITTNLSSSTTFTLTVTDAIGCQWSDNATINIAGACLSVNPQANPNPICNGQVCHLAANAFGGSNNYTYSWTSVPAGFSSSSSTPEVNPIVNTTYTALVNDGFTTVTGSVSVIVNPLPALFDVNGGGDYCSGGMGVPVGLSGSQSGVSYQLYRDGNPDGSPINGTDGVISFGNRTLGGTYTVNATWLATGCSVPMNGSVTITIDPLPTPNAGIDLTIPYGTSTSLSGTGSGGTGQLSYSWAPVPDIASGDNTLTPVTTNLFLNTSFTLSVIDSKGCSASDQVVVSLSGGPLSVLALATPQIICNTGAQVDLSAVGSGGSGSYTYSWVSIPVGFTSSLQNPMVTPSVNTIYTVTINDGFNSANSSVTVTVNPLPATFSITGGGEYCNGGTGIPVGLNGSETGASYQLFRDGFAYGNTLTGTGNAISFGNQTGAGTYTINATNSLTNCSITMSGTAIITINPLPVVNAGTDVTIPFGISTSLSGTATGGTGALAYSWTPLSGIASGGTTLTPSTTNLYLSTSFNLSVSDNKGCSASDQVVVFLSGNPLSSSISALPQVICNNGASVQLTANGAGGSGSYTYSWTSIPIGFTSSLSNPIVNPTQTTTYTVIVNDGFNTSTTSVIVTVLPLPLLFSMTGGGEYCFGGNGVPVGLSGSENGISYQLFLDSSPVGSPLTGTGNPLSFGIYSLAGSFTVTATNTVTTCLQNMSGLVTISINPLPIPNAGSDITIPFGTSTLISGIANGGTGSLTYGWTPAININSGGNTLTPLTTNLYISTNFTLLVTDSKGCSSSDEAVVFLSGSALNVSVSALPQVICNNGSSIQLNAFGSGGSGNYTYSWVSNPPGYSSILQNPVVTPNQSTVYSVTINDGFNTATSSVSVIVNPLPSTFSVMGGGEFCNGGVGVPVTLSGSETGILYQLLKDGAPIGGPIPGTGNALSFGNQILAGNYTVSATNITSTCINSMAGNVTISINPLPIIDAGLNKIIPFGTSTILSGTATGGTGTLNYSWIPAINIASGINTLTPSTTNLYSSTTFTLSVSDSKNCISTDQMMVILTGNQLSVQVQVSPDSLCFGGEVQLTSSGSGGSGSYTYSWISVPQGSPVWTSNLQNPVVVPTQNTTYKLTIYDGFNTASDSGNVVVLPLPSTNTLTGGGSYCFGGSGLPVGLKGSEIGVSYRLYRNGFATGFPVLGTGAPISFGDQTISGNYTIKGTRTLTGCTNWMSDTANVIVLPLPTPYQITGGGSYPEGGFGVPVGLEASDIGINYRLIHGNDTLTPAPGIPGTGGPLNFGNQTLAGIYYVIAQNNPPGCITEMLGNVTIIIDAYPKTFMVFGGGNMCQGLPGEVVGLSGSEIGVRYILRWNGDSTASLNGTGDSLNFGIYAISGTYTITGINILNGLQKLMNGNAVITVNPLPIVYLMVPSGDSCPGTDILLNGSQLGINYILLRNSDTVSVIAGTGLTGFLNFGIQTITGTYSITAIDPLSGCRSLMTGTLVIHPTPSNFNINPQGIVCAGSPITLSGSEIGVSYNLIRNGSIITAGPIPGTGSMISFGVQNTPGIYTVIAINNITGCESTMTGSSTLQALPTAFELEPQGMQCAGTNLFINGSQIGINYELLWNGIVKQTLAGTGSYLYFGSQTLCGTYTVRAIDPATTCNILMDGTTFISPLPILFNITPAGNNCSPTSIGLDGSQLGVNYQLLMNGNPVGTILSGTGGSLNFGMQNAGSYTVRGTLTNTSCIATMSGTVIVAPGPYVEAGKDTTVCYFTSIQIQGHANSTSTTLWTSSGDGVFANTGSLNTFYTPGNNDILTGFVKLFLHGYGLPECSQLQVVDSSLLTLHKEPVAHAGNDMIVCVNGPVQLDGTASDFSGVQWSTIGGNGIFSNPLILNPIYTPGSIDIAMGFARLKLTANGIAVCNGETSKDTVKVSFRTLPTASISGNTTVCSGNPANLTFHLTGTSPWSLSYTDGTNTFTLNNILVSPFIITVNPIITTTYTLLDVTDNFCNGPGSGSVTITVSPFPQIYPITSSSGGSFCEGGNGVVLGLSGSQAGISYQLLFGGIPVSTIAGTGNSISFGNYTTPGIYKVNAFNTLTSCQILFSDSINLVEHFKPIVNFTSDSTCVGELTNFHLTGSEIGKITHWHWDFGDGVVADYNSPINPSHMFPPYGPYHVVLTITDTNGCANEVIHDVSIFKLPVAFFSVATPDCANVPCTFSDHSTTVGLNYITRWHWIFDDGTDTLVIRPANPNVFHIYANPGSYSVTLIITTNEGCNATNLQILTIDPHPSANFEVAGECPDANTSFTDISQTGGASILEWHWNFGDPTSGTYNNSTLKDPVHIFSSTGDYLVRLSILTTHGCEDSIIKTVHINQAPSPNFTWSGICFGNTTQFTDATLAHSANILSWDWNFGDGSANSPLQNPFHLYSFAGTYNVTLTIHNSNGCINDTVIPVIILQKPVAEFQTDAPACIGVPVHYTNLSSTIHGQVIRWEWNFGDGFDTVINAPGIPDIAHTFLGTAPQYSVRLTIQTTDSCVNFVEHNLNTIPSPIANFIYSTTNCTGLDVQFTDQTIPGGGTPVSSYTWNFNDPSSGTANTSHSQNPSHIFASAGTYNVMLVVKNSDFCSDTIFKPIVIHALPITNFSSDTACFGTATQFTDHSVANASSLVAWDWNFGDGSTHSFGQDPSHSYSASGIYTTTLTVTNSNGCSQSVSYPVLVLSKPIPAFIVSSSNCAGTPVAFTDLSIATQGYINKWIWVFGDGSSQTIYSPPPQFVYHTYANGGNYNVSLTVETSTNCQSTFTNLLIINYKPVANFGFSSTNCIDVAVHFSDSSQSFGGSLMSWSWNFGDPGSGTNNTSGYQNPLHVYSASGNYIVTMITTNIFGCKDTVSKTINISHGPSARFTSDTVCKGNITHFTDQSIANSGIIASWSWNFGDGTPNSILQNPTHTYATAGHFNASLIVTNSFGCQSDTVRQVTVNTLPIALFTTTGSCLGAVTTFQDQSISSGLPIIHWHWNFGDGDTSNIQNPTHIYSAAGTFIVILTVTNSRGCTGQSTTPVFINNRPIAAFSYISTFCPAGRVMFTDNSTSNGSPITNWYWTLEPGFNSTSIDPVFTYAVTNKTYPVSLIVTDGNGCKDTLHDSPVFVKPAFHFTFTADTVCLGRSTQFYPVDLAKGDSLHNLRWSFNDPESGKWDTSSMYFAIHTFSHIGNFMVKLIAFDANDCSDSIYKAVLVIPRPIADFSYDSIPHCDGNVVFYNKSIGNGSVLDSLVWDFGDGTVVRQGMSASNVISHHYTNFGDYKVGLRALNGRGCEDTVLKSIRISCVTASFSNDSVSCSMKKLNFNDYSAPADYIDSWTWQFGDGTDTTYTKKTAQIHHTYTQSGNYPVKLLIRSVRNGYTITDTLDHVVTIHSTTIAQFSHTNVCQKDSSQFINLTDSSTNHLTSILWNFGEPVSGTKDTSSLFNAIHLYRNSGKYNVKLIVKNDVGCLDTLNQSVTVYKHPNADFSVQKVCSRQSVTINNLSQLGDTLINRYSWDFGDAENPVDTSNQSSPKYTYHQEGVYQIHLFVQDANGCRDTVIKHESVILSPISAFTINKDLDGISGKLSMNNKSLNATLYEWDFGNGNKSNEEDPEIIYSTDGSYLIRLITWAENKCSDTTYVNYEFLYHNLFVPNALSPSNAEPEVRIFKPVGVNLKQYHVEVMNSWGHVIWESSLLDDNGKPVEGWDGTLNNQPLPQDTYVWKISAVFKDGTIWDGSDIGKGKGSTMGTVALIR